MEPRQNSSTGAHIHRNAGQTDRVAEVARHVAALEDADSSVRWMAIVNLGTIGNIAALSQALTHPDSSVRWYAITSLAERGDIPALIQAFATSADRTVRLAAVRALAGIDDVAVVPVLIQARMHGDWDVRAAADEGISELGVSAVPTLIGVLSDPDSTVRRKAADALGNIGDLAAVPALTQLLADPDHFVRWDATLALNKMVDIDAFRCNVIAAARISTADRIAILGEGGRMRFMRQSIPRYCQNLLKREDIAADVKFGARAILAHLELLRHSTRSPATEPEDLLRAAASTPDPSNPRELVRTLVEASAAPTSPERRIDDTLGEASIQNCGDLFPTRCPKKWVNLKETDQEDVAFCTSCRKNVYLCYTREDAASRRYRDQCIALLEHKPNYRAMHPMIRWFRTNPIVRKFEFVRRYMKALINGKLG